MVGKKQVQQNRILEERGGKEEGEKEREGRERRGKKKINGQVAWTHPFNGHTPLIATL